MTYLLAIFLSILIGSGLGIFMTTYYYPAIFSLTVAKYFLPVTFSLVFINVIFIVLKTKNILPFTLSILFAFLSFSYSTIKSKERLDNLLKTPPQNFVKGTVTVSFLNKIFVNTEKNTIIVYIKKFDKEFVPIGAEVIVSGRPKHIYHYLTNKNMFGYFLYLLKNNTPYVVYSTEETVVEVTLPNSEFLRIVNLVKQHIYNTFSEKIPHTYFLSTSLIMGESSEISKEFREEIRITGISHIFSVSGFHVGIIVVVFVAFLNILRIPKILQFVIISTFLVGYCLIVGMKPPVVRASILASTILLIRAINLSPSYLNITLIAGIIMLLVDPFLSVDVGFILSFFAVISIILFSRYVDELIISYLNRFGIEPNRVVKNVITLFSVSLTAVIFTFPVVILWFGSSSITGIVSSVILVPLSSLNITSGIVAYIIDLAIPSVGSVMFRGVNLLNIIFIILTEIFSKIGVIISLKFDFIRAVVFVIIYYLLVIFVFLLISNRRVINERKPT